MRNSGRLLTAVLGARDLALEILFPEHCAGCGAAVRNDEYGICGPCLASIEAPVEGCPVCGAETEDGACVTCGGRLWYIESNVVAAEYSGTMKKVYRAYKFGGRKRLHVPLARLARERLDALGLDPEVITWVPMTRGKEWKRGYNQSEVIARRLSKLLGVPCFQFLREIRGRDSQRELGRRGRFINVLGRYGAINHPRLRSAAVLLVDDVFTTGATINECGRQLRAAGASSVFSLTIARAGIKKLEMI